MTCGAYVFYGHRRECLYVGSSMNVERRVAQHKYWHLAVRIDVIPHPFKGLRDVENDLIKELHPQLNKIGAKSHRHCAKGVVQTSIVLTDADQIVVDRLRKHFKTESFSDLVRIAMRALQERLCNG